MICVSVQEKSFGDCRAILESCEMAELRADLCRLSVEEVERLVEIRPNLIATCRIANSSEAFAREQLEAAIRRGARYVDIEIEAPDEHLEYIRTLAREYGCRLIVSFHDFEGTPSLDELKGIARLCRTKGADLVKIVTTARNISDAARTMRLYDLQADGALFEGAAAAERPQLVAFSMGEAGKFTRLLCLKLGAPYTYVSAGASNATASGQYTREEMERLLCAKLSFRGISRVPSDDGCRSLFQERGPAGRVGCCAGCGREPARQLRPLQRYSRSRRGHPGYGLPDCVGRYDAAYRGCRSGALGTLHEDRNRRIGAAHAAVDSAGIPYFRFERRCPGGNFRAWQYSEAQSARGGRRAARSRRALFCS